LAYIEYKDYGKGAKVIVHIKHGINTFYYPVWRRVWCGWGWYTSYWGYYEVPYAYVSKIP
jgi:hypothetical protein